MEKENNNEIEFVVSCPNSECQIAMKKGKHWKKFLAEHAKHLSEIQQENFRQHVMDGRNDIKIQKQKRRRLERRVQKQREKQSFVSTYRHLDFVPSQAVEGEKVIECNNNECEDIGDRNSYDHFINDDFDDYGINDLDNGKVSSTGISSIEELFLSLKNRVTEFLHSPPSKHASLSENLREEINTLERRINDGNFRDVKPDLMNM